MSNIYAGGNKATAIAAIKAAINARITERADGAKVLNKESLVSWLRAEFNSMFPTEATSLSYLATVNVNGLVNQLASAIAPEKFEARTDYPKSVDTQLPAVVASFQGDLERLSADVTSHYAWLKDAGNPRLANALSDFLEEMGTESRVPPGVERIIRTKFCRHTFVTDRGEESAPSPVSEMVELDQNDAVKVERGAVPSGRNIAYWRVYCSAVGNESRQWLQVPNPADPMGWPIATTSIIDQLKDEQLGAPLETLTWEEPPEDLRGLTAGANGGIAGFVGNTVHPCVNYYPYAFRVEDQRTTRWPIVAMASIDQTYVVLTTGRPYYMTGADSASLDVREIPVDQACVSAASVVTYPGLSQGDPGGVLFASGEGVCAATLNGVSLITADLFTEEEWRALNPPSIRAAFHDGAYIFCWTNGGNSGAYSLDVRTGKLTKVGITASAFYRDLVTDRLYYAEGSAIKAFAAGTTRRVGVSRTKVIEMPGYAGFSWVAARGILDAPVTVKLYAEGALVSTTTLTNRSPARLPPGRFNQFEVEVESSARVSAVVLASSTEELRRA